MNKKSAATIRQVLAILLFLVSTVSASAQYYMNIFRTDGARVLYNVSRIDSVSVQPDNETIDNYQLIIYAGYGRPAYNFSTTRIDSITYRTASDDIPAASYAIQLLSPDVVAYEPGGWATVRFQTTPRNLLLGQTDDIGIQVTDLSGTPHPLIETGGMEFIGQDSTWQLKLRLNDDLQSQGTCAVSLCTADIIKMSGPFTVRKVTLGINSIRTGSNKLMTFDSNTLTYSYKYNGITDLSSQRFLFDYTGDSLTIGDSLLLENRSFNTLDVRKPVTVTVWCYDIRKEYTIRYTMTNTNLPVVCINTNGKSIVNRKDWVEDLEMYIMYPNGDMDFEGTLSMRGRGNGTWTEYNKKPYALKLDEKAKILGMHKHKRWILLANAKDRTLLRNDAALWISRQTDLPYTVSGRYVELVMNGVHKGNYYLCEQAKIDKHRINTYDPDLEEPENGGFFVEIDTFFNYGEENSQWADKKKDIGFWSSTFNLPFVFKEPDIDEITTSSPAFIYFRDLINEMETVLIDKTKVRKQQYEQYIDVDKAIDYLLIQELTMNHDAYQTWPKNGPHSAFLYIDTIGKICFGPVWDFDYHTFTLKEETGWGSNKSLVDCSRLQQWELMKLDNKGGNKYYFDRLAKDTAVFTKKVVERWDLLKDKFAGLPDYIDLMADSIRASEAENYKVWGAINNPNGRQNGDEDQTFDEAIRWMKEAFRIRWQWLDRNLRTF